MAAALLLLGALAALAAATVTIRSDAAAVIGPDGGAGRALDTPAGREMVIAFEAPSLEARNAAAREVAAILAADPLVAEVRSGPVPPGKEFQDWLWLHRFQISPPAPEAFSPGAMAARLAEARARMTSAEGMALGDRLIRDPTGSFADLLAQLRTLSGNLTARDGIWQAKDDSAALVFVTLADRPFDTHEVEGLASRVRELAAAASVTPHLIGPRVVAAGISAETERASARTALIALGLLIAWLGVSLGSLARLGLVMLPLSLGFIAASLAVQATFGSVHVIALGFGGALVGLALDYPLHLIGHPGEGRPRAARLVMIGAATTAVGFLAMFGSGIPALMQTGLFVACGLVTAALASRVLVTGQDAPREGAWTPDLGWRLPHRPWVEAGLILAGAIITAMAGSAPATPLFQPPEEFAQSLERLREMVDLPSGRHVIVTEGDSLGELLAVQSNLKPPLEMAVADGVIDSYTMAGRLIASSDIPGGMSPAAQFEETAAKALAENGMSPGFAAVQRAAYQAALTAPVLTVDSLAAHPETRRLLAQLEPTVSGWREQVRLTGLTDQAALDALLAPHGAGVTDLVAPIEEGVARIRQDVLTWLGIGAMGAFLCLVIGLRDWRRAAAIARSTAAALGLTVGTITLIGGPPGIFEIAALTLVVGIGVDYGLFLRSTDAGLTGARAQKSVLLCAGSTLIAFTVMAFSTVALLHQIGLTVSLGVLAMLVLNLAKSPGPRTESA
ncbi:hypothetical protein KHP62_03655 [Rhodobacteraceae bacterium NNCM2]|nr:hypothetical protein [Coraliihabitans acroporae]